MKLLIVGSRSITGLDISPYIPDDVDFIISGGAEGIDTLAEQYADKMKISKLVIRPNYARYKRGAPLKRNTKMVDVCDKVLVFWDGTSKGTKHTIEYAQKTGKQIEIIRTGLFWSLFVDKRWQAQSDGYGTRYLGIAVISGKILLNTC